MRFVWTIGIAALCGFVWAQPTQGPRPLPAQQMKSTVHVEQKLGAQIPLDVEFKDDQGKPVRIGDYFGSKPVLLQLMFYRCGGACLDMREASSGLIYNMKKYAIARDYEFVVVGIHPKETPELAASTKATMVELSKKPETGLGLHLLTGTNENIHKVADAVGFRYEYDPETDRITHAAALMIVTPDGKVSRYFYEHEYPTKFVMDAIETASNRQVGPQAREIFWGCMSIDPITGARTVKIERVLQIVGTAFGLLVLGSIIKMSIKYRTIDPGSVPVPQDQKQLAMKEGPRPGES